MSYGIVLVIKPHINYGDNDLNPNYLLKKMPSFELLNIINFLISIGIYSSKDFLLITNYGKLGLLRSLSVSLKDVTSPLPYLKRLLNDLFAKHHLIPCFRYELEICIYLIINNKLI